MKIKHMKKQLQRITLLSALFLSVGYNFFGQNLFTQDTLTVCGQSSYDMVSPFPSNFNVWKKTGEEEVIVSSTMTFRSSGWYHLYTSTTGANDVSICQVFNSSNSYTASLNVPAGYQITSLQIALWGTPNINCVNPTPGSCNTNVTSILSRSFVGKSDITYFSGSFPDPCNGTAKYLYAKYICTPYIHDSIYVNVIPSQTSNVPDFVSCNNLNQEITLNQLSCDTTFQYIQTITQSANNTTQSTLTLEKGQLYRLKVSNTISFGGGAGNQHDAAYSNYPMTPIADIFWRFNGYQPGPLSQFRPIPDGYNFNHIYYFYIMGDGSSQDIGIYDCCLGDNSGSISIDVEKVIINANCGLYYLLNNVSINNVFQVPPSNQINHLFISNGNGKCLIDSFFVYPGLSQNIDLGPDTINICGINTTLDVTNSAAGAYSWNTGETTPSILVSSSGEYHVTVTDTVGCSSSDTVYVSVIDPTITAGQSAFCLGDSTTLSINTNGNSCGNLTGSLQNGLVGWWPFCGNANDESGNGNNGTVNGATLTTDRFGNANRAYSFDGVNDGILLSPPTLSNQISISFWVFDNGGYPNSTSINPRYISSEFCNGGFAFINNYANSPSGLVFTRNRGNAAADIHSMINTSMSNWQHIALTYNGSSCLFYINSILAATVSNSGVITVGSNMYFGYSGCASGTMIDALNGLLDDIGIWNRALTQQEIEQLYNQGNISSWWSDGTTNQTSIQVQPSQNTTYSVTVSDGIGSCTDSITIQVNNPQINAGPDISVCTGDSTTLTATGASTYAWDNGVVNGQAFVPTVEGYYNVTGTDTLGCSNSVSIFLDLLQPTSSSVSPVNCVTYTAPDGVVYTNSGQYTAIIPNAAGCDSTISINLTINNTSSGTDTKVACDSYTWIDGNTYTSSTNSATYILQNANGCDSTVTLNLTINKLNGLNAGNDINACEGENITLSATGATIYNWSGGVINGVPFVPPAGTTIYTVTGTDDNGCTATDALTVLVEYCLDIPGGISPNGDNSNDTWTINGLDQYPDVKVLIFDRWGQKVFTGDATNPTWNGTYEGKELPTADYYYIIELGNGEKFNGVVTLKK
jgi:gliding motility-associated-like protein